MNSKRSFVNSISIRTIPVWWRVHVLQHPYRTMQAGKKELSTHTQVCPSELGAVVSQPLHSYMLGSYAMTRTNEVTRLLLYLYNIYVTIGYTRRTWYGHS